MRAPSVEKNGFECEEIVVYLKFNWGIRLTETKILVPDITGCFQP